MDEHNNTIELKNISDLHQTLRELKDIVQSRADRSGLPRIYFFDNDDRFTMLLQENSRGFNVSGTLNSAVSYQLNGISFSENTEIGNVILKIAGVENKKIKVEEFFV